MAKENLFEGTKHIVHISTDVVTICEHCIARLGSDKFAESVNHYIEQHGYKLLHVGTETIQDDEGNPWHTTVAVLGVENPPEFRDE